MSFKTVNDVNLREKIVLLRADYNVPIKNGKIEGDFRIKQSLQTLEYILDNKPKALIIISHLGRPEGKKVAEFSLKPIANQLEKLLGKSVAFVSNCIGPEVRSQVSSLPNGSVCLLENLRFHEGEEANDQKFAKELVEATGAEIFVQDGFGVVHRAHASTEAITKLVPSCGGLLLERENEVLNKVMKNPARPLTAVVGGAKISDKIEVLEKFVELADAVAVVGALANNFLLASGVKVGKSLIDKDNLGLAEKIIKLAKAQSEKREFRLIIPTDGVMSEMAEADAKVRTADFSAGVAESEMILDIGPSSTKEICETIEKSKTVVWSGTCGMAELKNSDGSDGPFSHASREVAEAMIGKKSKTKPFSVAGGGDTTAYIEDEGFAGEFDHVSTGGSASLELMSGKKLPGIEALPKK